MKYRLLSLGTILLLGGGFLLMRVRPESLVWVLAVWALLPAVTLFIISKKRALTNFALFQALFPTFFFVVSAGLFGTIINHAATYSLFAVLASFLGGWNTEVTVQYLKRSARYHPPAFEILSLTLNILSLFFMVSWLFAFVVFFSAAPWKIILPAALVFILFFVHSLSQVSADREARAVVSGISILLLIEAFGVISFLPFGYFTLAALLTLIALFFYGIGWSYLEGRSLGRAFRLYGGVLIVGSIITLLSTRWAP